MSSKKLKSAKIGGNGSMKTRDKTPTKTQPKDRKLREQTKCKIFREIENKLFDTRIDNARLNTYLKMKQIEKRELIKYEWASDKNLISIRFFCYLLLSEIETIIDNIDESRGAEYTISMNDKLEKRNNIISHLLREKATSASLIGKTLGILDHTSQEVVIVRDLIQRSDELTPESKSFLLSKLELIESDMTASAKLRELASKFLSAQDYQNLAALSSPVTPELQALSAKHLSQLSSIKTNFELLAANPSHLQAIKDLQSSVAKKEQELKEANEQYEKLLKDFVGFVDKQKVKQETRDLKEIELEQQIIRFQEEARSANEHAKKTELKARRKTSKKSNSPKRGISGTRKKSRSKTKSPDRSKSRSIIRRKKKSDDRNVPLNDTYFLSRVSEAPHKSSVLSGKDRNLNDVSSERETFKLSREDSQMSGNMRDFEYANIIQNLPGKNNPYSSDLYYGERNIFKHSQAKQAQGYDDHSSQMKGDHMSDIDDKILRRKESDHYQAKKESYPDRRVSLKSSKSIVPMSDLEENPKILAPVPENTNPVPPPLSSTSSRKPPVSKSRSSIKSNSGTLPPPAQRVPSPPQQSQTIAPTISSIPHIPLTPELPRSSIPPPLIKAPPSPQNLTENPKNTFPAQTDALLGLQDQKSENGQTDPADFVVYSREDEDAIKSDSFKQENDSLDFSGGAGKVDSLFAGESGKIDSLDYGGAGSKVDSLLGAGDIDDSLQF